MTPKNRFCAESGQWPETNKSGDFHRWALRPISVISDIGLSLISERPISD